MYAKFKAKFENFSDLEESKFLLVKEDAEFLVSKKAFAKSYESALMYLIAHFLTLEEEAKKNGGLVKGELTSKSVDALSLGFASAKTGFEETSGDFYKTIYGQRYLELRKANLRHFGVTQCRR